MNRPRRVADTIGLAIAVAVTAFLSYAFVAGSTLDDEEMRFAVLSAWLQVQALWTGHYAVWTPLLGLGIPQPFVPNFTIHPLAPLLGLMSPVAWVRLLLVVQTLVGAAGIWRLGADLGVGGLVRGVAVVSFFLATPVRNYVISDFWPSHYIVWTTAPWLLHLIWRLLDPSTVTLARTAGLLGLTAGIVTATANPAYLVVWAPLALAVCAARWRMTATRGRWLLSSAAIALALAAPTLTTLATERAQFTAESMSNVTDPLPWSALVSALAAPFDGPASSRSLFVGGPFALLAIVGGWCCARARADLVAAAVASAMLAFTTAIPIPLVSQRYQFRDVLIFCAIPLAALAAHRMLAAGRAARSIGVAVLVAQVVVIGADAVPVVMRTVDPRAQTANLRGASGDAMLADTIVSGLTRPGRLLYSPGVEPLVSERVLVPDGLGVNALAYRGVALVNGSFKGVSADTVWPDDRLFYGRIRTPRALIAQGDSLDALGIRYVLALREEPVPTALRPIRAARAARDAHVVLYENLMASSGAFVVPLSAETIEVPVHEGCPNDRILCRDLSTPWRARLGHALSVERTAGAITVSGAPRADAPALLVVAEMFRPGWQAWSGDRALAPRPVYGGLLGVPIPAGASEVQLRYRPAAQYAAALASIMALCAGVALAGRPVTSTRPSPSAAATPGRIP